MPAPPASEETTILATYTARRDAEMARDYLDDAGIRTFVRADDAGGMHPQLQRAHGVKLVGMRGVAPRAREMLAEADLLPDEGEGAMSAPRSTVDAEGLASSVYRLVLVLGVLAVVVVLLMVLLG
jgi:hypothetical protein